MDLTVIATIVVAVLGVGGTGFVAVLTRSTSRQGAFDARVDADGARLRRQVAWLRWRVDVLELLLAEFRLALGLAGVPVPDVPPSTITTRCGTEPERPEGV